MSEIVALKPHERKDSSFYLDVYLRPVSSGPEELLRGSFGIALAEALYREGSTGRFLVIHSHSSEVIRVTPEGPVIYARSLWDRTLSGEILWFGYETPAYRLLGISFVRDRRYPIMPQDGPKIKELDDDDPLFEAIKGRIELVLKTDSIDYIVTPEKLEWLERERFEYEQAEKLVSDLSLELLDKFENSH